eukprot:jgi/Galph1/4875/GphlegSOOS_G3559.1
MMSNVPQVPETSLAVEQRFLELLNQKAPRKACEMLQTYLDSGGQLEEQSKRKLIKKLTFSNRADLGYNLYQKFWETNNAIDPSLLVPVLKGLLRAQHQSLTEKVIQQLDDWIQQVCGKNVDVAEKNTLELSGACQTIVELAIINMQNGDFKRSMSYLNYLEHVGQYLTPTLVNNLIRMYSKSKKLDGVYAILELKAKFGVASDSDTNTLLSGAFVKEIHFVTGAVSLETLPKPLPEVAFIGKSNVGKSSLLNLLVNNYSIAYTSKTPGKTQQLNYFVVNRSQENGKFFLVDLPGYGYAKVSKELRSKWIDLIKEYLEHRRSLLVLFHLIDGREGLSEEDRYFIEFLLSTSIVTRYVAVLTKLDKSNKSPQVASEQMKNELLSLGFPFEVTVIPTSAKEKWGSDGLWLALKPVVMKRL